MTKNCRMKVQNILSPTTPLEFSRKFQIMPKVFEVPLAKRNESCQYKSPISRFNSRWCPYAFGVCASKHSQNVCPKWQIICIFFHIIDNKRLSLASHISSKCSKIFVSNFCSRKREIRVKITRKVVQKWVVLMCVRGQFFTVSLLYSKQKLTTLKNITWRWRAL